MEDSYVLQLLKPKFKDFHLCFCGFAECKPLHSYGPAARPNYILHYVMKGKGIYQVGETKYQLKEGQAFLIEPESLTFYQADKTDPWSYLWVGFGGTEAQRFVSQRLLLQSHAVTFRTFRHRQELVSPFLSGCALVVFYYRLQIFYHAIIIGEIIRRRVNLLFRNSHLLHAAKHDVVDGLGWNILERSF